MPVDHGFFVTLRSAPTVGLHGPTVNSAGQPQEGKRPEKSRGPYTICGVDITGTIGLGFADETGAGSTTGSMYATGVESLSTTESTNVSGTVSTNEMGTGAT